LKKEADSEKKIEEKSIKDVKKEENDTTGKLIEVEEAFEKKETCCSFTTILSV